MLRGAIIGLGNVARNGHVPGWLACADVEIVAAADVRSEALTALSADLPALAGFESAGALLDACGATLDFVDVCTPPAAHGAVVRIALERGLHVLCEKPLVLDAQELSMLARLAARRDRVLAAVHNWRYAPAIAEISALVGEGRIGAARRCRWEVIRDRPSIAAASEGLPNWRIDPALSGGGILVDHGWHAVYVIAGWLPGPLRSVAARLETRRHPEWEVEDTATVRLEMGDGAAEIFLTWAGDERKNRVEIEGASGTIRVDGRLLEIETAQGVERRELSSSLADGSHHSDWFAGVAGEFVGEVRDPAARGRSLAEAAVCVETIRLAQESSRNEGRPRSPRGQELRETVAMGSR